MSGSSVIFDDEKIKKNFFVEAENHLMRVILILIK